MIFKLVYWIISAISLVGSIRQLFKCSTTEPGIIPSLKNFPQRIGHNSKFLAIQKREYFVRYKDRQQLLETMRDEKVSNDDFAGMFFHINKFKYNLDAYDDNEDPEKINIRTNLNYKDRQNKLSYCGSCDMLRPPRAFHCSTCGCCVEVHDHHCPWVGTCVGRRNVRFFIGFIFWTSIHAFVVFAICFQIFFTFGWKSPEMNDTVYGIVTKAIMFYTALIGCTLFMFSCFQTFHLGTKNVASNEDIRSRWNGSISN